MARTGDVAIQGGGVAIRIDDTRASIKRDLTGRRNAGRIFQYAAGKREAAGGVAQIVICGNGQDAGVDGRAAGMDTPVMRDSVIVPPQPHARASVAAFH